MDTIKCEICGEHMHSVQLHLSKAHPSVTLQEYQAKFPNAPILSDAARERIAAAQAKSALVMEHAHMKPAAAVPTLTAVRPASVGSLVSVVGTAPMHEVFGLTDTPEVRNGRGEPIMISIHDPVDFAHMVPDIDAGHVWNVEDLKNTLMALEMNLPLYLYGHKGTGKTTDLEQICARTRRPLLRVQHTINMDESSILGTRVARAGETPFELGPLPLAMKHGWVLLADEYDFALANVLALYQPVLEGKSLVIKEADAADRLVRPSPCYRFAATGNTNGAGDETGLYQGTNVQNSANYDRFAMMIEKRYMDEAHETKIVMNRSGVSDKEAKKLVQLANDIRRQFEAGKLSDTISTRALVNIANIGLRRRNMKLGITLCFANKLSKIDKAVVEGVAQRIYG